MLSFKPFNRRAPFKGLRPFNSSRFKSSRTDAAGKLLRYGNARKEKNDGSQPEAPIRRLGSDWGL